MLLQWYDELPIYPEFCSHFYFLLFRPTHLRPALQRRRTGQARPHYNSNLMVHNVPSGAMQIPWPHFLFASVTELPRDLLTEETVNSVLSVERGEELAKQLDEVAVLLAQYQGRLAAEVEDRYALIKALHSALRTAQEHVKQLHSIREVSLIVSTCEIGVLMCIYVSGMHWCRNQAQCCWTGHRNAAASIATGNRRVGKTRKGCGL